MQCCMQIMMVRMIIDPTEGGIGRDPLGLREVEGEGAGAGEVV